VVVALDTPYGLARSPATTARIAAYGRTPAVFSALVRVLTGAAAAPGWLPVRVGSYPFSTGCPR
jgi:beta-N-acetylhexosaminidase